jgi:DNA-binding GntR family transcriptional regulator
VTSFQGLVVRRTSTAHQIADGLAERILSGAVMPGERLRESALAAELGVARNTIREAVRILELGGLVRHEINRGAVVIAPTVDALDALYVARERIETAAAAREPSAAQLAVIQDRFGALVETAASGDARRIVDADLAFHSAIVAVLDSSRIDGFFAKLVQELRFYLMVLSVDAREFEDPAGVIAEHEPIMRAIASGDRVEAERQARLHIDRNARRLQAILERGQR